LDLPVGCIIPVRCYKAIAGATLTDNFRANDILWQLSVFAYNISVQARITNSGHQMVIKIYKLGGSLCPKDKG